MGGQDEVSSDGSQAYEKRYGKMAFEKPRDKWEMVNVEIETELYEKAKEVLAKAGFTVKQACKMFLCWCAIYQEDAKAWLERAREDRKLK